MLRKLVCATVSAALCSMTIAPGVALAQDYRFSAFDAPRGTTATLNVRVPMGREHADRVSYGLTMGYGQPTGAPDQFGQQRVRPMNFADLRFRGGDLRNARIVGVDFANLDRQRDQRTMNLVGNPNGLIWTVGAVVIAGGVICFIVTDCFGDDDDNDNNN
ncbi:MAG TPA: hypothetical protein VGX37_11385 [Allosphingosinicella sp.]|jgi:hypothetical protein|nr:hypothetical protein [Allosphingosinicella sp.]